MARKTKGPVRGDVVEVGWVDILEDSVGDPTTARLARRTTVGIFWERKKDESGVDAVVTTTTLDEGSPHQQGWCIYPEACIVTLKVVRRARRGQVAA